jgi:hypothetical protein
MAKICLRCNIFKEFIGFSKSKTTYDGLQSACKECKKIDGRVWRENNPNQVLINSVKHMETRKLKNKEFYTKNKKSVSLKQKEYQKLNPKIAQKANKKWRKNNKGYYADYMKKYRQKFPHISRWRNLLKRTIEKLEINKQSLEGNTKTLMGYSYLELKNHLTNLNMDWDVHEIDHNVPITWFKNSTPINLVNHLANLKPITKIDNIKKSNKRMDLVDKEYFLLIKNYIKEEFLPYVKH